MSGCDALTSRGRPCRLAPAYAVPVPGAGTRRLCGAHARVLRMRGTLPNPPVPTPTTAPKPPRVLVLPPWTAEEDARLLAHAGQPAKAVAPLFPRSTVSALYQRRATLRREGRG